MAANTEAAVKSSSLHSDPIPTPATQPPRQSSQHPNPLPESIPSSDELQKIGSLSTMMADAATGAGGKPSCRFRSFSRLYRSLSPPVCALFLLCLLVYNGSTIFWLHVPFLVRDVQAQARMMLQILSETTQAIESRKSTNFLMVVVNEETPVVISTTHLQKSENLKNSRPSTPNRNIARRRRSTQFKTLQLESRPKGFASRVKRFFEARNGSDSLFEVRFFMTWISSIDSFGDRELLVVQRLINSNHRACLVLVSNSMDFERGIELQRPFAEMGFRVIPIAPDSVLV